MKRRFLYATSSILLLAFVSLFFAARSLAGDGESRKYGPFRSTSPDGGSCGQPWAMDMFDRYFMVKDNKDGTFRVREEFKDGTFVTTGPTSPGACEADSHHGTVVKAGVTGNLEGYLEGTVTSSTYNPNGCSASGADCTTTQGFLAAVFGPSGTATFTCNLGYAGCRFNFEYAAGDQGLAYHHWQDTETDGATEIFRGDIANY